VSAPLLSWNEWAILFALLGSFWASVVENTVLARRRALFCAGLTWVLCLISWSEFARLGPEVPGLGFRGLAGAGLGDLLGIDGVNAPLLPLISLLGLATVAVTLRSKIQRISISRLLLLEALLLVTVSAREPWVLILLLAVTAVPVADELRSRGHSMRVQVVHTCVSLSLTAGGWLLASLGAGWSGAGYVMLAAGVGIRAGLVPGHCWVVDLFENASFGTALIAMSPLVGAYAAARLLLPGAPGPVLFASACVAMGGALYNAAMSVRQTGARRFFCHLFLGHASLVFAGIALATPLSVTSGLVLWLSVPLSLAGLGLTIRSVEARTGRLSLSEFQGLHVQTPILAALFLITGLAAVGFPGTLGFFGVEMLTDATARVSKVLGVVVVLSAALSGIALVRAYGRVFLGGRHRATVSLRTRKTERIVFLALVAMLLGGTLWTQPEILSRKHAADAILLARGSAPSTSVVLAPAREP